MITRFASASDRGAIVSLLKLGLGESLMPKSEAYWRWKHEMNPFGDSLVLLAEEAGVIVGIRSFMQWQWTYGDLIMKTVRPVDTVTHPDFQRKGIFSKLTNELLQHCRENDIDFAYNTPNAKSKAGNLKIGWEENGKFPVYAALHSPLAMLRRKSDDHDASTDESLSYWLNHSGVNALLSTSKNVASRRITTQLSAVYLKWRYLQVPGIKYFALGLEEDNELNALMIYRIKASRIGRELRVVDCFLSNGYAGAKLTSELKKRAARHKVTYITLSAVTTPEHVPVGFRFIRLNIGPVVTVKEIKLGALTGIRNFQQWSPSLGDMELF